MPTRERGRPARIPIAANKLRSRATPLQGGPNLPLHGSSLLCQVLCGRDARAPGCIPPASLFLKTASHPRHSLAMRTRTALRGIFFHSFRCPPRRSFTVPPVAASGHRAKSPTRPAAGSEPESAAIAPANEILLQPSGPRPPGAPAGPGPAAAAGQVARGAGGGAGAGQPAASPAGRG